MVHLPFESDLSALEDNELIDLCRSKDCDLQGREVIALNQLISRYKGLIEKKVSPYRTASYADDIRQEAYLGLVDAIFSFDSSKEVLFYTYANVCISNKVKNFFLKRSTNKERFYTNALSLDDVHDLSFASNSSNSLNPEHIYIEQESYKGLIATIFDKLSRLEKAVLILHLKNYSYKEISSILEIPIKSVDNALRRAKSKLKSDS